MIIVNSIKFAIKKSLQYRANLISWVLADIAQYSSVFLGYYFISKTVNNFGGYSQNEILLYISCSFLINNIYAVFFADGVSCFCTNIINGYYDFVLIKPISVLRYYIIRYINIPASMSTVFLVVLNIHYIKTVGGKISLLYVLSILLGALTMGLLFFALISITLFGIRSEKLAGILFQMISISEKPDTVFPKYFRNVFTYIIPVFIFSAVPTRIALSKNSMTESLLIILAPAAYYFIFINVLHFGNRSYKSGVE